MEYKVSPRQSKYLSHGSDDEAVVLVGELPLGVPDVAAEEGAVGAPVTQGATACVPQEHRGHGQVLVRVIRKSFSY